MDEYKRIEIDKFILKYDGIYCIEFEYNGIKYTIKVFLPVKILMELIYNEGLTDKIHEYDDYGYGINFVKSTLLLQVSEDDNKSLSFITSEFAEFYQDNGLFLIDCTIKS